MEGFQVGCEFDEFVWSGGRGVMEGFDGFGRDVFEEEAGEWEKGRLRWDGGEGEVGPEFGEVREADEM
jgi:hypothetical protein